MFVDRGDKELRHDETSRPDISAAADGIGKQARAQGEAVSQAPKEEQEQGGYCQPPKKHQFQKGLGGNKKGRKANASKAKDNAMSIGAAIAAELESLVAVRVRGKDKKITCAEAIGKQIVLQAMTGKQQALKYLLQHEVIFCKKVETKIESDRVAKMEHENSIDDQLYKIMREFSEEVVTGIAKLESGGYNQEDIDSMLLAQCTGVVGCTCASHRSRNRSAT